MRFILRGLITFTILAPLVRAQDDANQRMPKDDADLRYWLENMVWHHRFNDAEIAAATGLSKLESAAALKKFDISAATKPRRKADAPLLVLPYPGGRHPRIGFLEGAIRPQRETKVSVFTPWDDASYVVVDVPEAIFTNLGLTYLAHTHVPTIWEKQKIELEKLEWNRLADGTLDIERRLPNGIVFGTKIVPNKTEVRMELWLKNGTKEKLTGMRVQNCVLLKGAKGFETLSNDNKVFAPPFAACKSADGKRWVITAWEPHQRTWGNAKCPCLHSDPRIPDCAAGETQRLRGWLSFYEGDDIQTEFRRIDKTGWRKPNKDAYNRRTGHSDSSPKTIDNVHETGQSKGKMQYGIYKLEGDKWIVCMTAPGAAESDRPKSFDTKDTKNVVFTFERVKDASKP